MNKLLIFSEMLPELFLKATTEEMKLILSTMTKSIKFDGSNVIVELKDTSKALQNIKRTYKNEVETKKVRTLSKASIYMEDYFNIKIVLEKCA